MWGEVGKRIWCPLAADGGNWDHSVEFFFSVGELKIQTVSIKLSCQKFIWFFKNINQKDRKSVV